MVDTWVGTDSALNALARSFPENDRDSILLKVVTVNALYSTNVYAVWRMAEHVHQVLARPNRHDGPELVDELAKLDTRSHRSFASKYAHFFLDRERFPILDQYVCQRLAYHIGARKVWPTSYTEFHKWYEELRLLCEGRATNKEIDQYLWIAGMYSSWRAKGKGMLSGDAVHLFGREDGRTQSLLAMLI